MTEFIALQSRKSKQKRNQIFGNNFVELLIKVTFHINIISVNISVT
jgi:hypothetical protein